MRDCPYRIRHWPLLCFLRETARLRIGLYAANAGFFLILAVFPGLLLLLGLLRYARLEQERLVWFLGSMLPQALLPQIAGLIRLGYEHTSSAAVGISAVTTVWSAGRGIYGLMTGLNAVYGLEEDRGYLRRRLLSVGYTFFFLLVLVLTLLLQVFGTGLLTLSGSSRIRLLAFLARKVGLRAALLLAVQAGIFCAMYKALPNRKGSFRACLPGALLSAVGWQLFSRLYSLYVEHFARLANVYGPVYGVALCMLWLYFCVGILFFGGALNGFLEKKSGKS